VINPIGGYGRARKLSRVDELIVFALFRAICTTNAEGVGLTIIFGICKNSNRTEYNNRWCPKSEGWR